MQDELEKLTGPKPVVQKNWRRVWVCSRRCIQPHRILLFSDGEANRIMKWNAGRISVFRENSNGSSALTFDHQGRLLTCECGRVTRTEKDRKITVLADQLQVPADLVYAIDSSIYFPDVKAIHQITRNGEVRIVASDCERPIGVAFAPNQHKLYAADSGGGKDVGV
jgi:gluconolactonase